MNRTLTLSEAAVGIKAPADFARALDRLSCDGVFAESDNKVFEDMPQSVSIRQTEREAQAFRLYMQELSRIPRMTLDALNKAFDTCTDDDRRTLTESALHIVPEVCELYADPMNVDVLQAGNVGLLQAVYDYRRDIHGVDFVLYAAFCIRHEVLQLVNAHNEQHVIGDSIREQSELASRHYLRLKAERGNAPDAEELSRESGVDEGICAGVIKQLNN